MPTAGRGGAGEALARIETGSEAATVRPPEADKTVSFTPVPPPRILCRSPRLRRPIPAGRSPSLPIAASALRRLPLVAGVALLVAALGVAVAWRLRVPSSPARRRGPLYVAVARPEVGLGAGREEVALAAAALQAAALRALASMEGVAALPPGRSRARRAGPDGSAAGPPPGGARGGDRDPRLPGPPVPGRAAPPARRRREDPRQHGALRRAAGRPPSPGHRRLRPI